ncbi:MAG: glycerol-3-phosphate 1-O-acyltransferase PlsY [Thermodesulfobacteriota bacterium]|nr:glycerol-3-phosphate 1-O-acyltransferase PlsY [Thermodesulfobacteriota bacterium]
MLNENIYFTLTFLIFAYLIGSIPFGVIISKLNSKIDIQKVGSGNIGATNVFRSVSKISGIITLLADVLKGYLPVLIACYLFSKPWVGLIGLFNFLGHLYPVYLKFRGGKGVAVALGIFLALAPLAIMIEIIIFIIVLLKWRYVSLGSITSALTFPIILGLLNYEAYYIMLSLVISILIIYKHKDNLKNLLISEENKFSLK